MALETTDGERLDPSIDDTESAEVLRSAGGIVWQRRDDPGGNAELILVHRHRYGGDWTLPKGKLHPDETWQQAALREVREETGCEVELGPFAGTISYPVDGIPKVVRFWHMRCLVANDRPQDDEVALVDWFRPDQAQQQMTYEDERALLRSVLADGLAYVASWL
jgi:ADP-ribose pyrophosphatase YjhB (NUDIX family)